MPQSQLQRIQRARAFGRFRTERPGLSAGSSSSAGSSLTGAGRNTSRPVYWPTCRGATRRGTPRWPADASGVITGCRCRAGCPVWHLGSVVRLAHDGPRDQRKFSCNVPEDRVAGCAPWRALKAGHSRCMSGTMISHQLPPPLREVARRRTRQHELSWSRPTSAALTYGWDRPRTSRLRPRVADRNQATVGSGVSNT